MTAGAIGGYALFVTDDHDSRLSSGVQGTPRIVFASAQDGDEDIYIVNHDGTGVKKLTQNNFVDFGPLASPDGDWVAYTRGRRNGSGLDAFLIGTDGTAARATRMGSLTATAWSPDSRMVLYTAGFPHLVRLFDLRRWEATDRLGPIGCCTTATWSPDGSMIAGLADDFETSVGIVLIDVKTLKWRWLYRGRVGYANPVWSPDSGEVAFTLSSDTTRPDERPLAVVSVKSRRLTRIAIVGPEQDDSAELAWAPGPRLVFSRIVDENRSALFAWDGRHVRAIPVRGSARDPHWSSDGRTLAFRWSRSSLAFDDHDIAVLRRGRVRSVTPLGVAGRFFFGGWSHGRRLRHSVPPPPLHAKPAATLIVRDAALLDVEQDTAAVSEACGPIVLWHMGRLATRKLLSGCEAMIGFGETTALALARSRLAWAFTWTDRREGEECLMLADTTAAIPRVVSHADCDRFARRPIPAYKVLRPESIDLLDGVGDTLAFSYSSSCYYQENCKRKPSGVFRIDDARATRVVPNGVLVAVGVRALLVRRHGRVEAFGRGRIARLAISNLRSGRVGGETVVIVGEDKKLRLLSARSGRLLRTITLRPVPVDPPRLEDADAEYALAVVDGALQIIRLRDARSIRVALGPAVAPIHARLSNTRLVVSYNRRGSEPSGRVVVFSRASITAAFG